MEEKPKAGFHYQQIISFGQLQIASATKQMQSFLATVPDLKMFLRTTDLTDIRYLNLLTNKLSVLSAQIHMALGEKVIENSHHTVNLILERARQGSVVYQIPASTEKVNGMLPFFCEDPKKRGLMLACPSGTLDIRFNVGLIKKVLGSVHDKMVQINIEKAWTDDWPVLEHLTSLLVSGMEVHPETKVITIRYHEVQRCRTSSLCAKQVRVEKQIESRKSIEAALFSLIDEKDESLKLYTNE